METHEARPRRRSARWWQRATGVLPVTIVLALALGVSAFLVPSVREQLRLSTTRIPESYVALYAEKGTTTSVDTACVARDRRVPVLFYLRPHGNAPASISYEVTLRSAAHVFDTVNGSVRTAGYAGAIPLRQVLKAPPGRGWVITVRLTRTGQTLALHCRIHP